jgi:hypothetical protein
MIVTQVHRISMVSKKCPVENLAPNKLYEPVKVRENALT